MEEGERRKVDEGGEGGGMITGRGRGRGRGRKRSKHIPLV